MSIKDFSYGIIPLKRLPEYEEWHVLLVQCAHGRHWAFPKGHIEPGESALQTAERELLEETGLKVKKLLTSDLREFTEHYHFFQKGTLIDKEVAYFLAEVEGTVQLQHKEVDNCLWLPLRQAEQQLTYPEAKAICRKAVDKIYSNPPV